MDRQLAVVQFGECHAAFTWIDCEREGHRDRQRQPHEDESTAHPSQTIHIEYRRSGRILATVSDSPSTPLMPGTIVSTVSRRLAVLIEIFPNFSLKYQGFSISSPSREQKTAKRSRRLNSSGSSLRSLNSPQTPARRVRHQTEAAILKRQVTTANAKIHPAMMATTTTFTVHLVLRRQRASLLISITGLGRLHPVSVAVSTAMILPWTVREAQELWT